MREFFVGEGIRLKVFGLVHLTCIGIFILGLLFIYLFRNRIHSLSEKTKRVITISIISLMFLNMFIYDITKLIYGTYNYKTNLPLHFCFISGYLFMAAWLFKNNKLIRLTYFCGFIGPLVAIIWPDVNNQYTFVFYQFFISHHVFLLGNLFLYCAYNYEINKKDIIYTFVFCNCIFALVSIVNFFLGSNYIMSKKLPDFFLELYPIFKNIENPYLFLEVSAVIITLIAYIFSKIYKVKSSSIR